MQTETNEDTEVRAEVRRQVRALRGFYMHAGIYLAVIAMLVLINIMSGDAWRGNWWAQWPALGWGVAVAIHGLFAYQGTALFGPEWEQRKVDQLMRERNKTR